MLGYAAYTERFAGDLAGVADQIDYLQRARRQLPAPDAAAAAAGGRQRRRLRGRRTTARSAPTSAPWTTCASWPPTCARTASAWCSTWCSTTSPREHDWAQARPGRRPALPRLLPRLPRPHRAGRATSATLPEVFPDFAPGSFTWDDELDGWVWTTFNAWQWDVNWANPDVFAEYADIILFLANLGVEVLRLDAIAFIWKRLGTNCQNQPEVHAITQALRARGPDRLPGGGVQGRGDRRRRSDLVHYLGPGRAPRQGQRPRLPQQPDGADLVDAGHPATPRWPRTRCGALPPAPADRPPGSPTSAATTTSAGRSTTTTPRRSG